MGCGRGDRLAEFLGALRGIREEKGRGTGPGRIGWTRGTRWRLLSFERITLPWSLAPLPAQRFPPQHTGHTTCLPRRFYAAAATSPRVTSRSSSWTSTTPARSLWLSSQWRPLKAEERETTPKLPTNHRRTNSFASATSRESRDVIPVLSRTSSEDAGKAEMSSNPQHALFGLWRRDTCRPMVWRSGVRLLYSYKAL